MGSQQQTRGCWGDHASYLETLVLPENPKGSGMFRKSELAWCTGPCEGLGCTFTPAAAVRTRIPRTLLSFKERLSGSGAKSEGTSASGSGMQLLRDPFKNTPCVPPWPQQQRQQQQLATPSEDPPPHRPPTSTQPNSKEMAHKRAQSGCYWIRTRR